MLLSLLSDKEMVIYSSQYINERLWLSPGKHYFIEKEKKSACTTLGRRRAEWEKGIKKINRRIWITSTSLAVLFLLGWSKHTLFHETTFRKSRESNRRVTLRKHLIFFFLQNKISSLRKCNNNNKKIKFASKRNPSVTCTCAWHPLLKLVHWNQLLKSV